MNHPLLHRISPKGGPFIGRCAACGKETSTLFEDCPKAHTYTPERAILEAISGEKEDGQETSN